MVLSYPTFDNDNTIYQNAQFLTTLRTEAKGVYSGRTIKAVGLILSAGMHMPQYLGTFVSKCILVQLVHVMHITVSPTVINLRNLCGINFATLNLIIRPDWATLCYRSFKEILVPPKIRVLSSGTVCQTLDLVNFTMASQWCHLELSSSTVECRSHQ